MKIFKKLIGLTFIFSCIATLQADAQYMKNNVDTGGVNSPRRFCIRLIGDSAKVGDLFIEFRKYGQMDYDIDEDGLYALPVENAKLCSLSADGYPLITNVIPFPSIAPEVIKLYVCPKSSGAFKLNFDSIKTIPRHIKIILIDKYLNCVVKVKQNKSYSFNIDKKDDLSYLDKRFVLVVYRDENYSFRPEAFGVIDNKKKIATVSATAQAAINRQ